MVKILIIDDSEEKVIRISKSINTLGLRVDIQVASDLSSARRALDGVCFDLLVLDQLLPVRSGENVLENGGVSFLRELNQNKVNNIPKAVFGLSVSPTVIHKYFWPFFDYNDESQWNPPFKSLLNYLNLYNKKYGINSISQEHNFSIYVEGHTEYLLYSRCFDLFHPKFKELTEIKYEHGAAWVVRQLFAKVFLLPKESSGKIIKCCAVLDDDGAGRKALETINKTIPDDGAERRHFKVFMQTKKLSPILKNIPYESETNELEDLLPPVSWIWAYENNCLSPRNKALFDIEVIDINTVWNQSKHIDPNISVEQLKRFLDIYSRYHIKDEHKKKVISYTLNFTDDLLQTYLLPYSFLLGKAVSFFEKESYM